MSYSALNVALPSEKFGMAGTEYSALYNAAITGDEAAIQEFLNFSSQYLDIAQSIYKSSPQYRAIWQSVMDDLNSMRQYAASEDYQNKIYNELMELNSGINLSDQAQNFLMAAIESINIQLVRAAESALPTAAESALPTGGVVATSIGGGLTNYTTPDVSVTIPTAFHDILPDFYMQNYGFDAGGISTGPESGHWEKLHGTEAVIPLGRGDLKLNINAKELAKEIATALSGGKSNSVNVTVEIGGEQFDTHIANISDNVRVKAERRKMGTRRIYQ